MVFIHSNCSMKLLINIIICFINIHYFPKRWQGLCTLFILLFIVYRIYQSVDIKYVKIIL